MDDSGKVIELQALEPSACSLKQDRAVLTRKHLVKAARAVFAKNGFEHASIEDIAAKAGKTRGAFYFNFEDKEDVFFAIFEEDLAGDRKEFTCRLSNASTTEQRVEALTQHLAALLRDQQRTLLYLEFKMYVIRHPHKRKRLTNLHKAMCLHYAMTEVEKLVPELAQATPRDRRKRSSEIAAALDGLALNRLFDPESLEEEQLVRYLRLTVREAMLQQQKGDEVCPSDAVIASRRT